MSAESFKRGERIYAAGFLRGEICTGIVRRDSKNRDTIMVKFDMTGHRMWFPFDRITKDYDL